MARKPREEVEGGVFHVYARGNDKRPIYDDDVDRRTYLQMLQGAVERCRWKLLAFCLMPNHVHLLVETPEANLAVGMHRIHGDYAQHLNRRHRRTGHVFQGRYGAVRVKSDEQLWMVAAYIAANPVRAGLCGAAEEWEWGSHAATVTEEAPDWLDVRRLFGYFGLAGGDGRVRYAEMVRYAETVRNAEGPAGAGPSGEGARG